ncbi:MAG: F0F1 ATP synthase subunit B [Proteobacteria bacterium]|nr:F0F1 ATP synthase subunit B [Pseudomonadota bacterium]
MAILQDPSFWASVAFVIFIAAAAKPISRLAVAGLDKRADKIRDDLDEAEKLREEAQDLLANYQRKQRDAIAEAEAIVAHAGEEAERLAGQAIMSLEASLERRRKLALERIAQAEAQALDRVLTMTVDIALDATHDFLANELKDKQANALTDAAIKDLAGNLH